MPKAKSLQKQEKWAERIRLQINSEQSVKQWCQEHNLSTSVFYYWKGVLHPFTLERSSFTELPVENKSSIILECDALRIYLENDFDANALKRCLQVIKEDIC